MNTKRKSLPLHQQGISSLFSCELIDSSASPRREDIYLDQPVEVDDNQPAEINQLTLSAYSHVLSGSCLNGVQDERGWGVFMS